MVSPASVSAGFAPLATDGAPAVLERVMAATAVSVVAADELADNAMTLFGAVPFAVAILVTPVCCAGAVGNIDRRQSIGRGEDLSCANSNSSGARCKSAQASSSSWPVEVGASVDWANQCQRYITIVSDGVTVGDCITRIGQRIAGAEGDCGNAGCFCDTQGGHVDCGCCNVRVVDAIVDTDSQCLCRS